MAVLGGDEGCGFSQDLLLHAQHSVLSAQLDELLALAGGQSLLVALVDVGPSEPVAQAALADADASGDLSDGLRPLPCQLDGTASELRRMRRWPTNSFGGDITSARVSGQPRDAQGEDLDSVTAKVLTAFAEVARATAKGNRGDPCPDTGCATSSGRKAPPGECRRPRAIGGGSPPRSTGTPPPRPQRRPAPPRAVGRTARGAGSGRRCGRESRRPAR